MSGIEVAGLAFAAPAVVQQLIEASLEGYRIFQGAQLAGKELQQHLHEL
jgi:hypothetical protein